MHSVIQVAIRLDASTQDVIEASGNMRTDLEDAAMRAGLDASEFYKIPVIDEDRIPRIVSELAVIEACRE